MDDVRVANLKIGKVGGASFIGLGLALFDFSSKNCDLVRDFYKPELLAKRISRNKAMNSVEKDWSHESDLKNSCASPRAVYLYI